MGPVVRGIAATIGFARERYVSNKEAREAQKNSVVDVSSREVENVQDFLSQGEKYDGKDANEKPGDSDDVKSGLSRTTSADNEEALPVYGSWELDEAQETVADNKPDVVQNKVIVSPIVPQSEIPHLAEKFAATYPLQDGIDTSRLDCSIIIPQRRPNTRRRGFIRAYAPVLEAKGIPQDTFLDFIDTFNVASQANPILHAINLASFSAHALPLGVGIAVSEAIRLAADVSIEAHSRYRTNNFLDRINKLYFLPRGLICFPMIWKPSISSLITSVAIDSTAAEQNEGFNVDKKTMDKFKAAAGSSRGNVHFPDAAPLTFPLLNNVADSNQQADKTLKQKLIGSIKTTEEYFDRRAQVNYAMKNPHSGLSHLGAKPQFKSRYSDPSHPASSGSLLGLVTGGAVSTHNRRIMRRQNQKGGLTSLLAPNLVFGGSVVDSPDGSGNVAAVADFLQDVKLSNVIGVMRGKVSNISICW
jgi:hypothetical protein